MSVWHETTAGLVPYLHIFRMRPGQIDNLPRHIAIIMDGNGRWAKQKGLLRVAGHAQGARVVRSIVKACAIGGIKALTLFVFSSENWKRPQEEISALMKILNQYLDSELTVMMRNNIRFNTIGDTEAFPEDIRKKIEYVKEATRANSGLILTLALNYGSRFEILNAAVGIAKDVAGGKLDISGITEELFNKYLYTNGLPELDLVIRTSGEMRLSNFLLWQASYAEIYVTKKLWPDFTKQDLNKAIADFAKRERRFGGI